VSDLYKQPARDIVALLSSGQLAIREALDAMKARIDAVDGQINALPTTCFERAYAHASKLQALPASKRGELAGLPVTIKDLTPVEGVRTTYGSRIFENFVPETSDQMVSRIEQRGGVIYAKSNVPEFGAGGITFNEIFPRTATPHDLACSAGGSSGGAAASLASGSAWLSQGSDMAGSLRTPAAFCGVASLRPSPGTITADSLYLPFDVLGENGPMARDVKDLALFADVMRDQFDNACRRAAEAPRRPTRVAVSADLKLATIDDEVRQNFTQLLDRLDDADWPIEVCEPDFSQAHSAFDVLRAHVFAVGLEELMHDNPGVLKEELAWNVQHGINLPSADIRHAQRQQGQLVHGAATFMRDYDVLLCPATSVVSAPLDERYVGYQNGLDLPEYYRWLSIAYATTMATLPVITLPWSLPSCGKPGGIQLVGKPWGDASLFSIAAELEPLLDWDATPIN